MIWYEVIEDLGDGSSATRRFKTREEAKEFLEWAEEQDWMNYVPDEIRTVDTDSEWFWHTDYKEEE